MQVNLELYPFDFDREPLVNIICNVVPRVDEWIKICGRDNPANGTYRVLKVEHVLDPSRNESVQHVCLIVLPHIEITEGA